MYNRGRWTAPREVYVVQLRSRRSSCSLYKLPSRSRVGPRSEEEEEEGVVEAAGLAGKQPAGSCAQLRRRRQAKQHQLQPPARPGNLVLSCSGEGVRDCYVIECELS